MNINNERRNCVRATCFFFLLIWTAPALSTSDWLGYINDKGRLDEKYGYIETRNQKKTPTPGRLRLTCYPPLGFRVYLSENQLNRTATRVTVKIDQLDAMDFSIYQDGNYFFINDQSDNFWNFIAQLVAGISLEVRTNTSEQSRYSLRGFATAYKRNCGWVNNAQNYLQYIDRYR